MMLFLNKFLVWLNRQRTIYYLMLVAFIIRAGFGIAIGHRFLPMADQIVFDDMAKNLAHGKGLMLSDRSILPPDDASDKVLSMYLTRPERRRDLRMNAVWGLVQPNRPTAFFEPMVPIIFGSLYYVLGEDIIFPRLFQSLLDALVVGMLFSLGKMIFPPKSPAPGISALIYTFYPFSIMFTGGMITQPIYLFLQCAVVYLFYVYMRQPRLSTAILFGLTLGMTILARIAIIAFFPCFIFALFVQKFARPKYIPAFAGLILSTLLLFPWIIRNQKSLGSAILFPTKGGRNLWENNNQHFTVERLHATDLEGVDILVQKFALKNSDRIKGKQYLEFPEFTDESEIERDRILNYNVIQFIKYNPGIFVQLCAQRLYMFYRVTPSHFRSLFFKIAAWGSFGWILPLSIFGGILLWRHWRKVALIYLLILYNTAVHTLTSSGIPLRLPIDPFLILFASFSLVWIAVKLKIIRQEI